MFYFLFIVSILLNIGFIIFFLTSSFTKYYRIETNEETDEEQNKRKFFRLPLYGQCCTITSFYEKKTIEARIIDISANGIRITPSVPFHFSKNETYICSFKLKGEPFYLNAKLIRKINISLHQTEYAFSFENMNEHDVQSLLATLFSLQIEYKKVN